MQVQNVSDEKIQMFSSKFSCPVSGFTITDLEPRLFSFNNPQGACPACSGLGFKQYVDPKLVIPDENKTIREGAIAPWATRSAICLCGMMRRCAR